MTDAPALLRTPLHDRHVALGAVADFATDIGAVGAVAEAQQRQQHELLELSEHGRVVVFYMYHSVKYIEAKLPNLVLPRRRGASIMNSLKFASLSSFVPHGLFRERTTDGFRIVW